jgi:glyoxylase-like metal-dependent hydrolase (beta-lactamase superfamily II)
MEIAALVGLGAASGMVAIALSVVLTSRAKLTMKTSQLTPPLALIALLAVASLHPLPASAQPKPAVMVNRLAEDLWEIPGVDDAANVTVLVTDEGLVVVDARFDNQYDDLIQVIRERISAKPVKYLINTHYHSDHTGANDRFAQAGATVIGSVNTRQNILGHTQANAPPNVSPPTIVFSGEMRLYVGGKEVRLTSYGPAHTDSDISVLFPKDRVICTGDLGYAPDPAEEGGPHPLIDYRGGGSIDGWIARLDTITAMQGYDVVVPGHVDLATRADLITYRNVLERVREDIRAYLRDGTKTEADLRAHLIKDLHWPATGPAVSSGTHGLYTDLKP